MKIIVNPEAGSMVSLNPLAEAKLPFEMCLWEFYNMLGIMNSSGCNLGGAKAARRRPDARPVSMRFLPVNSGQADNKSWS
jgi:hypothetical protein